MVLESLFNPFAVKKRPWEMFVAGFLYSIVGLTLSYLVFREVSGLLTVFLIVLATLPLLYVTIKNEEEIDLKYTGEWKILKEHSKVLVFLIFLFLNQYHNSYLYYQSLYNYNLFLITYYKHDNQ